MGYENLGVKLNLEGEKEFKNALWEINNSFKVLGSEFKPSGAPFNDRVQKHSKKGFRKQKKSPLKRCKPLEIKGFSLYQKVSSFMVRMTGQSQLYCLYCFVDALLTLLAPFC